MLRLSLPFLVSDYFFFEVEYDLGLTSLWSASLTIIVFAICFSSPRSLLTNPSTLLWAIPTLDDWFSLTNHNIVMRLHIYIVEVLVWKFHHFPYSTGKGLPVIPVPSSDGNLSCWGLWVLWFQISSWGSLNNSAKAWAQITLWASWTVPFTVSSSSLVCRSLYFPPSLSCRSIFFQIFCRNGISLSCYPLVSAYRHIAGYINIRLDDIPARFEDYTFRLHVHVKMKNIKSQKDLQDEVGNVLMYNTQGKPQSHLPVFLTTTGFLI